MSQNHGIYSQHWPPHSLPAFIPCSQPWHWGVYKRSVNKGCQLRLLKLWDYFQTSFHNLILPVYCGLLLKTYFLQSHLAFLSSKEMSPSNFRVTDGVCVFLTPFHHHLSMISLEPHENICLWSSGCSELPSSDLFSWFIEDLCVRPIG